MPATGHANPLPATRVAVVLFAALAACAAPVPPPDLHVDLPRSWASADDPGWDAAGPAPDLAHWWRVLGAADLEQLVDRALRGNLSVAAAAQRVNAARALLVPAQAAVRPGLHFGTDAAPNPDSRSSWFQAGFDARWELGLFGRAEAIQAAAQADLGAADADGMAARVSLVAEVVRTWLEERDAVRRAALLDRALAVQRERLRLWQVRAQTGQAAGDELARARIGVMQADAARLESVAVQQRSRRQMALLLGELAAAPEPAASGEGVEPFELRVAQTPADLLRTRPEIRRAEQRVLKAASAVGEARASLYPRLALGGLLSSAASLSGGSSGVHTTLAAGPVIDMPLFDWGSRRAVVDARAAELAAATLDYRQAVLEGVTEVQTALLALELRRQHVAGVSSLRAQTEQLAAAAATRERLGLADSLERLAAADASIQSELALEQARLAHRLAFVALYKALGGGDPDAAGSARAAMGAPP